MGLPAEGRGDGGDPRSPLPFETLPSSPMRTTRPPLNPLPLPLATLRGGAESFGGCAVAA